MTGARSPPPLTASSSASSRLRVETMVVLVMCYPRWLAAHVAPRSFSRRTQDCGSLDHDRLFPREHRRADNSAHPPVSRHGILINHQGHVRFRANRTSGLTSPNDRV